MSWSIVQFNVGQEGEKSERSDCCSQAYCGVHIKGQDSEKYDVVLTHPKIRKAKNHLTPINIPVKRWVTLTFSACMQRNHLMEIEITKLLSKRLRFNAQDRLISPLEQRIFSWQDTSFSKLFLISSLNHKSSRWISRQSFPLALVDVLFEFLSNQYRVKKNRFSFTLSYQTWKEDHRDILTKRT